MNKNKNERQQNILPIGQEPRLTEPDLQARIQDHLALLLADEGYRSRLHAEARVEAHDQPPLIREYLRFAYLAWVMPEGATPSKAVDEAWHTHILFTRSYHAFCLAWGGAYLHHHPGTGKGEESAFRQAYHRTLDRYRSEFGEPPDAWWPDDRPKRVAPAATPSVSKPAEQWAVRILDALLILAIPIAVLGATFRFGLGGAPSIAWMAMGIGTLIGLPIVLSTLSGPGAAGSSQAMWKDGDGGGPGGSCGGFASCSAGCGGGGCGS